MGSNKSTLSVTPRSKIAIANYRWSPRLKHNSIDLSGANATRTANFFINRYGYTTICSLADCILNDGRKYSWKVRINSIGKWVYIGICQIKQAEKHSFLGWNWGHIGHGHYCVSSSGLVFSHSDENVNNSVKSPQFKMGDVLLFEYDAAIGRLIVVKNRKKGF